jgi:hypothetical protein
MWEVHDTQGTALADGFQSQWDALDWMDEQGSDEYMELAYIDNPIK